MLSVALSEHESGALSTVGFAGVHVRDETRRREGEQTVARKLYRDGGLEGAIITSDTLHNSQPDAGAIFYPHART